MAKKNPAKKIPLRNRLFDARPDRADFRDLPYRAPLRSLPACYPDDSRIAAWVPSYIKAGLVLDQGEEGACTGFGLACVVNYLLWTRGIEAKTRRRASDSVSPRMLYELARRYDEWRGEEYDGSSCRGALKGWHKHGVCSATLWPYSAKGRSFVPPASGWEADALARTLGVYYRVDRRSIVDIQAAIVNIGAVYVSAQVHDGWDVVTHDRNTKAPRRHDDIPDIPLVRSRLSGHSFALVGYDAKGFIVQNSWGRRFGAAGFARMSYADWAKHGTDAWACALGVPGEATTLRVESTRWFIPAGGQAASSGAAASATGPADDPWPIPHEPGDFDYPAYQPLSTAEAYQLTLVTGNDGRLCIRDMSQGSTAAYAKDIMCTRPKTWLAAWRKAHPGDSPKVAIYAHGGLNGEDESLRRIRVLAPYFLANGIYPLFLTWQTGAGDTLRDIVEDWFRKIPGFPSEGAAVAGEISEKARDGAIEPIARWFGRGIWSEMRENADCGMDDGHGLALLSENLEALAAALPGTPLELHLVGHSAGSILLGHLLERMSARGEAPTGVSSCSLLAPACSVEFANERYLAAAATTLLPLERLWLYVLSDDNEKRDGLPTPERDLYSKSLLYLVSRALDDHRKMPILGLHRALLADYAQGKLAREQWHEKQISAVQTWQQAWNAAGGAARTVVVLPTRVPNTKPPTASTADGHQGQGSLSPGTTQATHGSFDNNITVLTQAIERIAGRSLVSPMEWLDY